MTDLAVEHISKAQALLEDGKETKLAIAAQGVAEAPPPKIGELSEADLALARALGRKKPRNPMITISLIMNIVQKSLKDASDAQKKVNRFRKKEWEGYSKKQAANFREHKEEMEGGTFGTLIKGLAIGTGQAEGIANFAINFLHNQSNYNPESTTYTGINNNALLGRWLGDNAKAWVVNFLNNNDGQLTKDGVLSSARNCGPTASRMLEKSQEGKIQIASQGSQVKEAEYQQITGALGSEFGNDTQQQSSDKAAIDNARDTARQLYRTQAEQFMGR